MNHYISFLKEIIIKSNPIALKYFQNPSLASKLKENNSPVSQADLEIETVIRDLASKTYPNMGIIGEEHGQTNPNAEIKLIIDPIDGTKNYIAGIPFFATLLAIQEHNNIVAGLVSAPATNDVWWAEKGKGSFHNGKKIMVSTTSTLQESLALHGSLYGSEAANDPLPVLHLLSQTYRQRGLGDYLPHMLVAEGKAEFAIDFKLQVWDIAPLKIIVEEAGGQFSDTNGTNSINSGNIISSNGHIHSQVLESIFNLS